MSSHTPSTFTLHPSENRTRAAWHICVVVACLVLYLLPGIVGREPWKQDEMYTFGIVQHMAQTGDWIVPTNAGVPFMEKPPLFDWFAVGFMKATSGWLPAPDGARLATLLAMLVTFAATAAIARAVSPRRGWLARDTAGSMLLLAGTIGLVRHAHDLFTDVGLMAASAVSLYALIRIVLLAGDTRRWPLWRAALLLGVGVAATLMTKGLLMPGVFGVAALLVPLFVPACRTRRYAFALLLAGAVALPLMVIWPALLAERSMPLFKTWLWDNNVGRFLGFSVPELGSDNTPSTPFKALLFFAFPVGPLALIALARRATWRQPVLVVAALVSVTGLSTLCLSATLRELYLLPILPALTPLAASTLPRLPALVQRIWVWLARTVAAASLVAVWLTWWIMRGPQSLHHWVAPLGRWLPLEWELPARQPVAVLSAVALTLGWIAVQPAIDRSGRWRGAASWAAAMTLSWGLMATLLMPWIDAAKSYLPVFDQAAAVLAPVDAKNDCVASSGLGESEAPMFAWYTHRRVVSIGTGDSQDCNVRIVQTPPAAATNQPGWQAFWSGARPGDRDQLFTLYRRAAPMLSAAAAEPADSQRPAGPPASQVKNPKE
ncbi:4-amino-4-deoxy-L-arabinose transferase-like glycosyltransferase [Paraburkholderia sp. GAS448]